MFVHSADKLTEMRTKFHVIQAKLIMSVWCFTVHCYSLHFSVNNVAGHGIPDARELQEGDILNIDVTVFLDGFHGDCSATIPVGQVDDHALKLIQVGWSG